MDPRLSEQLLRNLASHVERLNGEVNSLRQFQESIEYEKQIQAALEIIERAQSNHVSYTNLIIVAGYAAFFTFWSTIKNDLPEWLFSVSGLLIIISLIIFIAWEVTKMVLGALNFRKVEHYLTNSTGSDAINKYHKSISTFDRKMSRIWIWFFIPTVALGLASGFCLVGFFVWKLWDSLF